MDSLSVLFEHLLAMLCFFCFFLFGFDYNLTQFIPDSIFSIVNGMMDDLILYTDEDFLLWFYSPKPYFFIPFGVFICGALIGLIRRLMR